MNNKWLFIVLVPVLTAASVWQLHPRGESPVYVTSLACRQCHQDAYNSWNNTLHPKMFRPVKNDKNILGDFNSKDPVLTFSKDEVEYVVGNRWEQIYVRKIDGEYYPFPVRWYVKQQKWSPYKVDSWQKTPMSEKCNGCHTTGFNPSTYEFSEFGVGCEACHGPGSRHVDNKKMTSSLMCRICHWSEARKQTDIIRSVSSTVCGQCHNRGKNRPFSDQDAPVFNFPVQYTPGEDLAKSFTPLSPEEDTKNKYWWGNGVAKARHQEFADWEISNHAKALILLKQNHSPEMGILEDVCLECHSTDYLLADTPPKPTMRTAKYGITCVGCHDPHKIPVKEESGRMFNEPCISCHVSKNTNCAEQTDPVHFPCPQDKVECVDCHMPYVVKSGGWNSIRGHAFIILSPLENEQTAMPNSCQNGGCHQDRSPQWVQQEYRTFYGNSSGKN
jgi:Cytochrome c552/Cytochrome c554 and c-prime/Doubled CXXCH motif (Paired_CXXCH_1)